MGWAEASRDLERRLELTKIILYANVLCAVAPFDVFSSSLQYSDQGSQVLSCVVALSSSYHLCREDVNVDTECEGGQVVNGEVRNRV